MASKDIQAAIEKARAVAAKLSSQLPDSSKRPADSSYDGPTKKFASVNDAVGAQLAMLKQQQMGGNSSEEIKVPDKLVGVVIGKGGDQLHRLQSETQCKIIIAPDAHGQPDRVFTIVGAKENIDRCRKCINDIIKIGAAPSPNDPTAQLLLRGNLEVFEMKVPGNKCGLIIGKGGETIKRLSEQYGVKLVVIQDTSSPISGDKPLRITGEPDKVARAKEAVMGLINPKEESGGGGGGRGGGGDRRGGGDNRGGYNTNEYGSRSGGHGGGGHGGHGGYGGGGSSGGGNEVHIKVPGDKAGVVIGKGGESVKEINRRSGAHVEIDKNHKNLPEGADKMFVIKGTNEQIQYAQQLIYEKITGIVGSVPPHGYFSSSNDMPGYASPSSANQAWAGYQWPGADPSKAAAADPNVSAAWAAYYQQYYGQQPGAVAAATPAASGSATAQPSVNPQTGQADYSQAWIEYYRSLGMHEQAEAILRQTQQSQTNGSSTNGANGSTTAPTQIQQTQQPANPSTQQNGSSATVASADPYANQNAAAWQQYSQQYNYANYYKQETGSRNG